MTSYGSKVTMNINDVLIQIIYMNALDSRQPLLLQTATVHSDGERGLPVRTRGEREFFRCGFPSSLIVNRLQIQWFRIFPMVKIFLPNS